MWFYLSSITWPLPMLPCSFSFYVQCCQEESSCGLCLLKETEFHIVWTVCVIFWFGNDFVHYILYLFFFATADIGQPCVCCCLRIGKLEILQWTCFHRRKYTSSFLWGWLPPIPKASEHRSALYTGMQTRAVRVCYIQFIYWVHERSLLASVLPCPSYFFHRECTPSGYLCYLM